MLGGLIARASKSREALRARTSDLRREERRAMKGLDNLYDAIESGVELDGPLRKRISKQQHRRDETIRLIAMNKRRLNNPLENLSADKIRQFADAIRQRLAKGPGEFQKIYLRHFIDRIEVRPDEIRITGPKKVLITQAAKDEFDFPPMVRTFEQEWRANSYCSNIFAPLSVRVSLLITLEPTFDGIFCKRQRWIDRSLASG